MQRAVGGKDWVAEAVGFDRGGLVVRWGGVRVGVGDY